MRSSDTRAICWLLACIALAVVAGRIAVVRSATGEVPFLSANDRSRWATVSSLVDDGTYAIDRQLQIRDAETRRRTWQTIDLVRHRDAEGREHYYSSKPPLLATMVAGVYAAVRAATGLTIEQHPFFVGRWVLALVNLPMLAALYGSVIGVVLRHRLPPWAAVFLTAAICFGTLLLPFSVSLNNHLPAAMATAVALWCFDRQSRSGATWGAMFLAGMAAAFAVANELPALSMAAFWTLLALRRDWVRAFLGFAPGALLVAVAFFGTNWIAHQSLRPPYAHRGIGAMVAEVPAASRDGNRGAAGAFAEAEIAAVAAALDTPLESLQIEPARVPDRWRLETAAQTYAVQRERDRIAIYRWDDWYDYPNSYWTDERRVGVDRGEPSRQVYAMHLLVGHHGLFSLTPVWLLALGGSLMWFTRRGRAPAMAEQADEEEHAEADLAFPRWLAGAVCVVTLVCLMFYIARPLIDRNYGGINAGFRWLLWIAPLWIWLAIPAVAALARHRFGRTVCLVLLAASVFSAATALENPWSHPWVYRYLQYIGWIGG